METSKLSDEEIKSILGNPCKKLSMVVLKKNAPKELFNVRKVKTEEVTEVEETKEEIEKLKEYEVLLEVSPRESVGDAMKCITEKLERGEELDVKELRFIEAYNKMVTQSSKRTESSTESTEKNTKQVYRAPISTELLKRKAKFLKQQQKEETFHVEEVKKEKRKETLEEKKKNLNKFWTEPPSDLKKVIEKNQFWQKKNEDNGGPMTTSAIFSHLNDLHDTLRKTPAREEKRQFWENCRKKYGWDPPETKYDLSHRLRKMDDITRSRSCEPEHLDRNKLVRSGGFRETNPFFSPSPTNPFYEECRSMSEEQLSRSQTAVQRGIISGSPVNVKKEKETCDSKAFIKTERSSELARQSESSQQREISSESNRQDFESKCEFFERATSVPTTSCVKNAQDIVSERLGATPQSGLKKPSDFINDIKTEQRKATLSRSSSQEEKSTMENKSQPEPQYRKVSLPEPQQQSDIFTDQKTKQQIFAGNYMQQHISSGSEQIDSTQFKEAERNITIERDNTSQKEKDNYQRDLEVSKSQVTQSDVCNKIVEKQRNLASLISESMHKNVERIEAEMNESIEKIKTESEKLKSLAFGIGCASTIADQKSSIHTGGPINIIPDTTAFPGLQAGSKMTSSVSGEFQKRSFVETSYEKVTKTGAPFENVESALRREFRVATPSGFYDNNTEEVFKQEAVTESFREAAGILPAGGGEDFIAQSLREFKLMEGVQPTYEYNCEIRSETSGEHKARSATMIQPGAK